MPANCDHRFRSTITVDLDVGQYRASIWLKLSPDAVGQVGWAHVFPEPTHSIIRYYFSDERTALLFKMNFI